MIGVSACRQISCSDFVCETDLVVVVTHPDKIKIANIAAANVAFALWVNRDPLAMRRPLKLCRHWLVEFAIGKSRPTGEGVQSNRQLPICYGLRVLSVIVAYA